ncbi:MAG: epoxyqueuosine reductase QueH [Treponema sp.]|jgi:predicted adenine nucleotide alpha hydrolase (AANH) superfamily ATPase|nr:epoxyqueuosine reductase QueH [Treponema sp.]
MKLLLHTCCGPCLVGCLGNLEDEGIKPVLFWYNPNIHPWTEYRSRRDCLEDVANRKSLELLKTDEYGLRLFLRGVRMIETGREAEKNSGGDAKAGRCDYCYRLRLEKTAETARLEGYDFFSTTLLISPYQRHDAIKKTGEELAAGYGIPFFYRDFRPFFRAGQKTARGMGLYTQKYCGCVFSEEERYAL